MKYLVTGAAGFIGASLVKKILTLDKSAVVVGLDNLNDYYDVTLKQSRLSEIDGIGGAWRFVKGDIADGELVSGLFDEENFDIVVNLAAQAGVRYSIANPHAYIESNVTGFFNILEACRHSYDGGKQGIRHLIYASSSGVYGAGKKIPYSVGDDVDSPVSLYAATKKSNELFAHAYSELYNIPSTGLRLFTVYGPGGRPDMAYFAFADRLASGEDIEIFNYGNCERDFTYIDDITEGIWRVIGKPPERKRNETGRSIPPYAIYNIGNSHPVKLSDFVDILHQELVCAGVLSADFDFESHKKLVPMQSGDVPSTFADTSALERDFSFKPSTPLREGLRNFARWYKEYKK